MKTKQTVLFSFECSLYHSTDLMDIECQAFENNASGYSANLIFCNRRGVDYLVLFENEQQKSEPYFKKSHLQKMRKEPQLDLDFLTIPCYN
ncbi:hypothetical protein ACFBZI_11745 [Moraxella sp. ZJ142]|uniref:hypothetical protein n=1 Tax=Moraxella marmotae TaxID=3344520 RepID=UPI0035D3E674